MPINYEMSQLQQESRDEDDKERLCHRYDAGGGGRSFIVIVSIHESELGSDISMPLLLVVRHDC